MKRASSVIGVIALASSLVAFPDPARTAPQTWIVEFCREVILPEFNFIGSLGDCVAYNQTLFNSEDHGLPTLDCRAFREFNPEEFYLRYETFGECVIDNV